MEFDYESKVLANATNYCLMVKGEDEKSMVLVPVREF